MSALYISAVETHYILYLKIKEFIFDVQYNEILKQFFQQ